MECEPRTSRQSLKSNGKLAEYSSNTTVLKSGWNFCSSSGRKREEGEEEAHR